MARSGLNSRSDNDLLTMSAIISDCLENARFIHLVIVGISATVIVFAISPRQSLTYESAIVELNTLHKLDLNGLNEYVERAVADQQSNTFKESVQEFLKESRLAVADSVKLDAGSALPVIFKYPPLAAPLTEVDKYFYSEHSIYLFEPNTQELKEQLQEVLASVKLERKSAGRKVESFVLTKITLKGEQIRMEEMQKAVEEFRGRPEEGVPVVALFDAEIKTDAGESVRAQQLSGHLVPLKGKGFKEWFRGQPMFKDLVIESPDKPDAYAVFPKLHLVWNEVLTLTPDGALVALEDKKKSGRQQVSFLGLSVEENIAIIAGPAALLMTVLYLFVHLRHIASFTAAHNEDLKSYPWVALFPDNLSRVLTCVSLVGLPMLANTVLLARSWTSAQPIKWIALIFAIASVVYGVKLSLKIIRLGRRLTTSS